MNNSNIAPGTRLIIRDAEWIVKRTDLTSTDSMALSCVGLSEIVKDKEAIFLTDPELDTCTIIDPAETKLVPDDSPSYRNSLLYIESLLRQTPPTDENLYVGHTAAMDVLPFQLQPAYLALQQPRARMLIADAVGLGKTIEVGILLSELIKRGRGKRILVLAVKSMLTQFQKELWARFTIPLVRLDSAKINRIKSDIPTNHNPFYFYDKTIISIDTLKQNTEYSVYLENAYWDIIVIDEAQNVAERGTNSQRAKLARLLASRSDSLIMLSATPHDGKKKSFASLMNKLNPTAIADPSNYGKEENLKPLLERFSESKKVDLNNRFSMIPMTDELFDEINEMKISSAISTFEFLTENIEQKTIETIENRELAYVESEFFGGQGGHIGVIWKNGKRDFLSEFGKNSINEILIKLGVERTLLKDEFESIGLAKNRHTKDWIEYAKISHQIPIQNCT